MDVKDVKNFEWNQRERIKNILMEKGYKEDMILNDFRTKTNFLYDLCVVDQSTSEILYVFEFKAINEGQIAPENRFLRSIGQVLGQPNISENTQIFYSIKVIGSSGTLDYLVNKEDHSLLNINLREVIPTYNTFKINREISYNTELGKSKNKILKTADELKKASISLAIVLFIFLLLDIFNVVKITNSRLILMGIIVATLVIPYFSTIKIGDLFEVKQK